MNKIVKDLNIRKWEYSKCTNKNLRDINASINILDEGLRKNMISKKHELQSI